MKNRVLTAKRAAAVCLAAMMAASMMSGCGSSKDTTTDADALTTENTGESDTEELSQIANPWVDTDAAGMEEATGLTFREPEGAQDIAYSVCTTIGMAQMKYTDASGNEITVRAQPAAEDEDISGMYMDFDEEENCTVGCCEGIVKSGKDEESSVQVCSWYDAVCGIMYCVCAEGTDLDGFDIASIAEEVYIADQQVAEGDSAESTESDDNEAEQENADDASAENVPAQTLADAAGNYTCDYDGSTISISEDGTVNVSVYRLASFDGTTTEPVDGILTFNVKDPNDGDMTMEFDTATGTLTVTSSTWDMLPEDTTMDFVK